MAETAGFEEIQHTADWALRVWAPSLEALFVQAALGMNALAGMQLADGPRIQQIFETHGPDFESLLVVFLSELIYKAEQEHVAFEKFHPNLSVESDDCALMVNMAGAPLVSLSKAIKAVTYHNLEIHKAPQGFEVEIVFDV